MDTGELACKTLEEMERLMNEEVGITGFEICQKLTGENRNQQFVDLIKKLKNLGIIESYASLGKNEIGYYIQLSDIGKNTVEKIKNDDMRRYFIVAITIYCNQRKFSSGELGELLSKTDSFESKDEVERVVENFRKMFIVEEKPAVVEKISKMAIRIKNCAFDMFLAMETEETEQNITGA